MPLQEKWMKAGLMALLRDHGEDGGLPWQSATDTESEAFFTLCAHSAPVHETTASLVASLPEPTTLLSPYWVSFAQPCIGNFLASLS